MDAIFSGLNLMQAQPNATGSMISTVVMFGAVFVIFYFMLIRPQNKKQKAMRKMIEAVKKGDKVVTIGGIHGLIHSVKDHSVIIKVDDSTKMEFSKSAIASVDPQGMQSDSDSNAEDSKSDASK